ncbi:MAG: GTP-binding protein TypA [Elusimicrobia bacterium RIFCSPLOWO2_01_FULL_54_10]|nr:MAG: GTP-binding protein TypA [Elusimicrobia bacterium RIFCSPLOWO2_01_FULL_54_10]
MKETETVVPRRANVRNIAIIAHVDHGKTTLVDALLRQTGEFKVKQDESQDTVLDSNPLERERGITILAKCTSVPYKNLTINIVDTPGHADFGSEVERILGMVDGCLLLVDAVDGPMPQTKFVLKKSLELGLHPIVVINKMDRENAKPHEVLDQVFSLFMDLGATDPQLDFPVVYCSGRAGWATLDAAHPTADLVPLFDTIVKHVPGPEADPSASLQMLVTILDYSSFLGQIAIGRIVNGKISKAQQVALVRLGGKVVPFRATQIQGFFGLARREIESASAGDIVAVAGMESVEVGETIAAADNPVGLPPIHIDEPTISMEFLVNDSPFAGLEGEFVTTRHIREKLLEKQKISVGLRVEELGAGRSGSSQSAYKVSGRGELQLSILIETMRREGFELGVSRPEVIIKTVNGVKQEPFEYLIVDIEKEHQGELLQNFGRRHAEIKDMQPEGDHRLRIEVVISARALIGFKSEFLTQTRGTGMMHHSFHGYAPLGDDITIRKNGVLIAMERGDTTGYALENLQERSTLFVGPGVPVYEGMIVGENSREHDLTVNPCKKKQLSNMRASGSDDAIVLTPPKIHTLEQAIEYISDDELVEVTPKSIRLRKKQLQESKRKK